MAPKTHLTRSDLTAILSTYSLGEYISHTPLTAGTVETNIRVTTTSGNYVFRLYENRSYHSVLFECATIEHLTQNRYPCPRVYRSSSGEVAGLFKGKPYTVFEFIEGKHIAHPTEEQKRQLIEHIAQLHNITEGFQPPHMADRWNYNPALLIQLAEEKTRQIGDENARRKLDWYTSEIAKLELPDQLPRGVCHSDFDFSNVLFKDGHFEALIDFDDANYTVLLFDLAAVTEIFMPAFDHNTWDNFAPEEDVFDFSPMRKTVDIYNQIRPLTEIEQQYFFDVCKLLVFVDCLWFYERRKAENFFERSKISYLNKLGREGFISRLFSNTSH